MNAVTSRDTEFFQRGTKFHVLFSAKAYIKLAIVRMVFERTKCEIVEGNKNHSDSKRANRHSKRICICHYRNKTPQTMDVPPKPSKAKTRRIKYAIVFSTNRQKEIPLCGDAGAAVLEAVGATVGGKVVGALVGVAVVGANVPGVGALVGAVVLAFVGATVEVSFVGAMVGAILVVFVGATVELYVGASVALPSVQSC